MKPTLYHRIREILDAARTGVARSVNTTQVVANWLIGQVLDESCDLDRMMAYAREIGLIFFSTAFDFRSTDFLAAQRAKVLCLAMACLVSVASPTRRPCGIRTAADRRRRG